MKTAVIIAAFASLALAGPIRPRQNLQPFSGDLGGIAATPVEDSGNPDRPFQVKGDTFVNIGAALQRSCDQQFNACANAANGGDETLSVSACSEQKDQCAAASQGASANVGNANQQQQQQQAQQGQNQNQQAVTCTKKAKRGNKKAKKSVARKAL